MSEQTRVDCCDRIRPVVASVLMTATGKIETWCKLCYSEHIDESTFASDVANGIG